MKTKIVRKEKISWVITDDIIYAFDKIQATAYHVYGCSNRKPLSRMRNKILSSTPEMYNSWVDAISLAKECNIHGYGARIRKEWLEES